MNPPRLLAPAGLAALGLIAGLGLGEATVRAAALANSTLGRSLAAWDPQAIKIEPHGESGYRPRAGTQFDYSNGTHAQINSQGFRGPAVARIKPPGTIRIILLGGSTTHGWGVDDSDTIDSAMRRQLGQARPGVRFEVINLGFDGYDSNQDLERLRSDGLPLSPDFVIFNSGINDVRNARFAGLLRNDPRTALWISDLKRLRQEQRTGGPGLWSGVKHYSYLFRLISVARNAGRSAHDGLARAGTDSIRPNLDAIRFFRLNVSEIGSLTHAAGAVLLLSTPPSALSTNYRPGDHSELTYWLTDARQTQAFRDSLDSQLRQAATELAARGIAVDYVTHQLPPDAFLDDAHLNQAGNRLVAEDFVAAIERRAHERGRTGGR